MNYFLTILYILSNNLVGTIYFEDVTKLSLVDSLCIFFS